MSKYVKSISSILILGLVFGSVPLSAFAAAALPAPTPAKTTATVTTSKPVSTPAATPAKSTPVTKTDGKAVTTAATPKTIPVTSETTKSPATAPLAKSALTSSGNPTFQDPNTMLYRDTRSSSKGGDVTGSFSYDYPLTLPQGRNGLTPSLALSYNSQRLEDGSAFGFGWDLPLTYIERDNTRGLNLMYSRDEFVSSMSGQLVSDNPSGTFVARTETGDFLTYTFNRTASTWTAKDKFGSLYEFGLTEESKINDSANTVSTPDPTRVFRWFLNTKTDSNGNKISYTYTKDQGQVYPLKISWNGTSASDFLYSVNFKTENVTKPYTSFKRGVKVVTAKRISAIEVTTFSSTAPKITRSYSLSYQTAQNTFRYLLKSFTELGTDPDSGLTTSLPPVTFDYTPNFEAAPAGNWSVPFLMTSGTFTGDLNNDGLTDLVHNGVVYQNTGTGFATTSVSAYPSLFVANCGAACNSIQGMQYMDITGDSKTDLWSCDSSGNSSVVDGTTGNYSAFRFTCPSIDGSAFNGKILDFNSDGLPDLVNNGGVFYNNGDTFTTANLPTAMQITLNGHDGGVHAVDINNDGLTDLVRSQKNNFRVSNVYDWYVNVYLNNGKGGFEETQETSFKPTMEFVRADASGGDFYPFRLFELDKNGDGFLEYLTGTEAGTGGNGILPGEIFTSIYPQHQFRLMDLEGDGGQDLLLTRCSTQVGCSQISTVTYQFPNKPELITSITSSQGAKTNITYKPSTQYRDSAGKLLNPELNVPVFTVSKITNQETVNNLIEETRFTYSGGKFYTNIDKSQNTNAPRDRKFAGFAEVTATKYKAGVIDSSTKTYFHQGDSVNTTVLEPTDSFSRIGRPFRVDTFNQNNQLLSRSLTKYEEVALTSTGYAPRKYLKVRESISQTFEGTNTPKSKAVQLTFDNSTGNLLSQVELGEVTVNSTGNISDTPGDTRTTNYTYVSSTNLKGLKATETVLNTAGTKVKESKVYYDGQSLSLATKGNPTKSESWMDGSRYVTETLSYNTTGQVISKTDAAGNLTTLSYDTYNLGVLSTTNALGHTNTFTYNYGNGQLKSQTDPNGNQTQVTFDGLGRTLAVKGFDPQCASGCSLLTLKSYVYSDQVGSLSVTENTYFDQAGTNSTRTDYLDSFGRKIQSKQQSENGQFITVDFAYDQIGNPIKTTLPYGTGTSSKTASNFAGNLTTNSTFDSAGRKISESNVLGQVNISYNTPWKTTVTDQQGKSKTTSQDAYGNLTEVTEANGNTTRYSYDSLQNLTKITDAVGNTKDQLFNGLSALTYRTDFYKPGTSSGNLSTETFAYDTAGRLDTYTDANGNRQKATYDKLNREVQRQNLSNPSTELQLFTFDSCNFGKGKLCITQNTSRDGSEKRSYYYNIRGQVQTEQLNTATVPVSTNTVTDSHQYTYDLQGRLTKIGSIDTSEITFSYTPESKIKTESIKDQGQTIFKTVVTYTYNALGQTLTETNGNNTKTTNTYDENGLFRLKNKKTTAAITNITPITTGTVVQDLTYTYDQVGNVTSILDMSETVTAKLQTMRYDELYRLVNVTVTDPRTTTTTTTVAPKTTTTTKTSILTITPETILASSTTSTTLTTVKTPTTSTSTLLSAIEVTPKIPTLTVSTSTPTSTPTTTIATTTKAVVVPTTTTITVLTPTTTTSSVAKLKASAEITAPIVIEPSVVVTAAPQRDRPEKVTTQVIETTGEAKATEPTKSTPGTVPLVPAVIPAPVSVPTVITTPTPTILSITPTLTPLPTLTLTQPITPSSTTSTTTPALTTLPTPLTTITSTTPTTTLLTSALPSTKLTPTSSTSTLTSTTSTPTTTTEVLVPEVFAEVSVLDLNAIGIQPLTPTTSIRTTQPSNFLYSEDFTYDSLGNRLSYTFTTQNQSLQTLNYYESSQPHQVTKTCQSIVGTKVAAQCTTLTYDKKGQLTTNGTDGYKWNWQGRLDSAYIGGSTTKYYYDTTGQRTRQVQGTAVTRYLSKWYTKTSQGLVTKHLYANDKMIATSETCPATLGIQCGSGAASAGYTGRLFYQHTDNLGSGNIETDQNGQVTEISDNYAFGDQRTIQRNSTTLKETRKYTGHEQDGNGLTYANQRYLNTKTGTFLSEDVVCRTASRDFLLDPQQLNCYSYGINNPFRYTDATGEYADEFIPASAQIATSILVELAKSYVGYKVNQAKSAYRTYDAYMDTEEAQLKSLDAGMHGMVYLGPIGGKDRYIGITVGNLQGVGSSSLRLPGKMGKGAVLEDSALVVRGGEQNPLHIINSAKGKRNAAGKLCGVSGMCGNGKSIEELSQDLPNSQIGVSTVGQIRNAGGDVVPTPSKKFPNHVDINGLDENAIHVLFTPTMKNVGLKGR